MYLNPYVNFHRPCLFPKTTTNHKGKETKTYPYDKVMTPYEKLKSLPDASKYLKPENSFKKLDFTANYINDNESAKLLQLERKKLFKLSFEQNKINASSDSFEYWNILQ